MKKGLRLANKGHFRNLAGKLQPKDRDKRGIVWGMTPNEWRLTLKYLWGWSDMNCVPGSFKRTELTKKYVPLEVE